LAEEKTKSLSQYRRRTSLFDPPCKRFIGTITPSLPSRLAPNSSQLLAAQATSVAAESLKTFA